MQRLKEAEIQVRESIDFIQTKIGTVPEDLIKIILKYYKKTLVSIWDIYILTAMEKKEVRLVVRDRVYNPQFIEQFKIIFLTTLTAIELDPNLALKLAFPFLNYYLTAGFFNKELSFNNAFEALKHLICNDSFNLEDYLICKLALRDKNDGEFLLQQMKALLLLIPGVQEHILTESDMVILLDILKKERLYPKHLVKDGEPAILHLEELKEKNYSLVTLPENRYARQLILDIQRCQKDVAEHENRLELSVMNILEPLALLPKGPNYIVAQYTRDEKYIPSLAKKVLNQLNSLKIQYKDRFKSLGAYPDVLEILEETLQAIIQGQSVSYYWGDPHASEWPEEYEYKAIKVLQRLINGVQIIYSGSEGILDRFEDKSETGSFFLLKFFKDFTLKQAGPEVDHFIKNLLELANTHTALSIQKSLLQTQAKQFSSITPSTPLVLRMEMEKELNKILEVKTSVKWPVNYVTMDEKSKDQVILYVRSDAISVQNILKKLICTRIHLSPLFIHKLLAIFENGVYREQWDKYNETKRGEVIKNYFTRLDVPTTDVFAAKSYGRYGYELKMQSDSFVRIKFSLFSQGKTAEVNPTWMSLSQTIDPIALSLRSCKDRNSHVGKVYVFITKFQKELERIAMILDSEKILTEAVDLLKNSLLKLNGILSDTTHSSGVSSDLPSELREALVKTKGDMEELQASFTRLIKQLSNGEMALSLYALPRA